MSNKKQISTIMKKHFYYLSLALGLAVSMTGFTSCGDDNTHRLLPPRRMRSSNRESSRRVLSFTLSLLTLPTSTRSLWIRRTSASLFL